MRKETKNIRVFQVEEMVEDFFRRPELWVVLKFKRTKLGKAKGES